MILVYSDPHDWTRKVQLAQLFIESGIHDQSQDQNYRVNPEKEHIVLKGATSMNVFKIQSLGARFQPFFKILLALTFTVIAPK